MSQLDTETEQTLRNIIKDLTIEDLLRYHQDYQEPDYPQVRSSVDHPEDYEFYAAVVNGVVVATYVAHKEHMSDLISAFSADPKIVLLSDGQKNIVGGNWTYNQEDGSFSQPL
jgi:hypothetical protein